jgi:hypothetical protein
MIFHRMRLPRNELAEQSFFQWSLIRALAFGERDWMVICGFLLLINKKREFLSVPGASCFVVGVLILGSIFGMLISFVSNRLYFRMKKKGKIPKTIGGLKLITWKANMICFPLIWLVSWGFFSLYYESYSSMKKLVLGAIHF